MIPGTIKQIFPGLLHKIGVTQKNYTMLSLVEKELFSISAKARIVGYKNNIIYIEVDSSTHYHELQFRKKELLKSVQRFSPVDDCGVLPELKIFLKGMARISRKEYIRKRSLI